KDDLPLGERQACELLAYRVSRGHALPHMKLLSFALLAAAFTPASGQRPVDIRAASALIERVVPGHSRDFVVEAIPDSAGLDVFEVDARANRIILRGSTGVAIASALNWYLENVARVNV